MNPNDDRTNTENGNAGSDVDDNDADDDSDESDGGKYIQNIQIHLLVVLLHKSN